MTKYGIERRSLSASLRAANDSKFELHGLAARYGVPSADLGGFTEVVAPGAFKRSLKSGTDVYALVNHSADQVLGRLKNNTLTLSDAPEGLRFTVKLDPANSAHRSLFQSVKRQDIADCSFAFTVPAGGDKWEQRGYKKQRTLLDVVLRDVSVCTYPAYPGATSVEARGLSYGLVPSWERLKADVRAIGMKVLADRQAMVEDMTLRAEVARIGKELGRDRAIAARIRFEKALLGIED